MLLERKTDDRLIRINVKVILSLDKTKAIH
jgi:hypothetical protein